MRNTTIIVTILAFATGGLAGAYALLADRPVERGEAAGAFRPAWSEAQQQVKIPAPVIRRHCDRE